MIGAVAISKGDSWTQKADFGGTWRFGAVSFSIGNKGYLGTGAQGNFAFKDFWEYDQSTNSWTQLADFVGTARANSVAFSIDGKGYIGTSGNDSITPGRDFWEYDPNLNTWIRKAFFGGDSRFMAVGFSIGNKGYIGTGNTNGSGGVFDFWEYNPALNSWTQKAGLSYIVEGRMGAFGFSFNGKGYIGTGLNMNGPPTYLSDFWEYDTTLNSWTQKASFPLTRMGAVCFSINNKGYAGAGAGDDTTGFKDFWEYNPSIDQWNRKTDIPSLNVFSTGVGFNILNKGYVYIGDSTNSFWEYSPDTATGINELSNPIKTTLYPNPFSTQTTLTISGSGVVETPLMASLQIYDASGKMVKNISVGDKKQITINREGLKNGVYFIEVRIGEESIVKKVVVTN